MDELWISCEPPSFLVAKRSASSKSGDAHFRLKTSLFNRGLLVNVLSHSQNQGDTQDVRVLPIGEAGDAQALARKKISITKTDLGSHAELLAIFDRLLSACFFEAVSDGLILVVPTNVHLHRVSRFKGDLEAIFASTILEIEVRKPSETPSLGLWTQPAVPQAQPTQTTRNPFKVLSPNEKNEQERKRRSEAPEILCSPALEATHQMARRFAQGINLGLKSQVLWVHGAEGSGKTSLIKQFNAWMDLRFTLRHVDVIGFLKEWRQSLDEHAHPQFVKKYRYETQVLVVDNLDQLQGKDGTQTELHFTINSILDAGGTIIVASNRNPGDLKPVIAPALFSRMFSGLVLEMPAPDRGFKEALWRKLIRDYGVAERPLDVALENKLLSIPTKSVRETQAMLMNAVMRLEVQGELTENDFCVLQSRHGQSSALSMGFKNPNDIIDRVAEICGVTRAAIKGSLRRQDVALARRFVFLALAKFGGLTNSCIASLMEKDPSTISHGLKSLEQDLEGDRNISSQWSYICSRLGVMS